MVTATFERYPASRATANVDDAFLDLRNFLFKQRASTNSGWHRDSTTLTRCPCFRTSMMIGFDTLADVVRSRREFARCGGNNASVLPSDTMAVPASTRRDGADDELATSCR